MSSLLRYLCVFFLTSLLSSPVTELRGISASAIKINRPVFKVKASDRKAPSGQQEGFEKLMIEGKRLYLEEMDIDQALAKFEEAESLAQTCEQKAEVNFYLSLIYYTLWGKGGSENFYLAMKNMALIDKTIRNLIVYDYYLELDSTFCPPRYVEAYAEVKKEYGAMRIQSSPPGAEVYIDGSDQAIGVTPLTVGHSEGNARIRVRLGRKEKTGIVKVFSGKRVESPLYSLKKRSGLIYWLGGTALVGGAAALLLIEKKEPPVPSGTIQVYSSPEGAAVFLDNNNTGKTTNCTLDDVPIGSHSVTLAKEGYKDESRTVVIEDGQIATVKKR